jgi:hypothetical protein
LVVVDGADPNATSLLLDIPPGLQFAAVPLSDDPGLGSGGAGYGGEGGYEKGKAHGKLQPFR